mgnify:CR=1 FL=1
MTNTYAKPKLSVKTQTLATIGAIVAAVVMTVVLMVSRFYRNLLRNEGYLMFTLPVSAHALVWSKLIVSLVWFLLTALLIFLVMKRSVRGPTRKHTKSKWSRRMA